jgi:hypothetical protein
MQGFFYATQEDEILHVRNMSKFSEKLQKVQKSVGWKIIVVVLVRLG